MPNLLLTNFCNRKCSYCFALAQVELGTTRPNWEMSRQELETVLGYLQQGRDVVSFLGGEPSLHSRFPEIVMDVLRRGYEMKIFTNGTVENLRRFGPEVLDHPVQVILNLNPPESYSPREWAEIEANFRFWGSRLCLSFNVHAPDFNWGYLRSAILDFGLVRRIRLGLAQPVRGMANAYVEEGVMRPVCRRLVAMAQDLANDGITLGFDCGFRVCSFTEEERGTLIQCGAQMIFVCRPVLDIGPDLMVWRCFPFSVGGGPRLTEFKDLPAVVAHFDQQWGQVQRQGNTKRCATCPSFLGESCHGGCLTRTTMRLARESEHA